MKTLIELYSDRTIENIIGPETFLPERVVYLCPPEIAQNRRLQERLRAFMAGRGHDFTLEFAECSMYRPEEIVAQLRAIGGDCTVDITGGTDAALFAAGQFCAESGTPVFTYSHNRGRFYNIQAAPFAEGLPCTLRYTVRDFFAMAGGTLREGRVNNDILGQYLDSFDAFFRIYLKYRTEWIAAVHFLQRASQDSTGLEVDSPLRQKGDHGSVIDVNEPLLRDLEAIGYLEALSVSERVTFRFRDHQIRTWLRDMGSVLELYMYKACLYADCFDDVVSSAVVEWDEKVSNEIDAVAGRGILPLFISCKICDVRTEALNELAILRDRFGGKGAKAVIVTTESCNAAARHRAAQLGIAVIDLEELQAGKAAARLQVIMKVREQLE